MSAPRQNLQDFFLHHLQTHKIASTVFLVNGVKLQGFITHFDAASLLLQRESHVQLVYKHAVSTIMPNSSIQLAADVAPEDEDYE